MKRSLFSFALMVATPLVSLRAQPSFEAAAPSTAPVFDSGKRLAAYHARIDEVMRWRADRVNKNDLPGTMDMAAIAIKLTLHEDVDLCSQRVIELMKDPGTG